MRYLLIAFLLAAPAFAEGPEFEVASIKPFATTSVTAGGGGPGTNDPTHLTVPIMSLKNLVATAFGTTRYQVAGPDTLDMERFSFQLVLHEGATKDDLKIMWRNLLLSRFGLKYHIEKRELPVDELVIGPKGHKLIENNEPVPEPAKPGDGPPPPPQRPKMVDGRPVMTGPGLVSMGRLMPNGIVETIYARAQTIDGILTRLSNLLEHPVIDKTGLTGRYDYTLTYSGNESLARELSALRASTVAAAGNQTPAQTPTEAAEPPVEIGAALQQQLGLRLVKGKGMLDVVVVDKIERTPTEN